MQQEFTNIAEQYFRTFGTPYGIKVLEHLTTMLDASCLSSNEMMTSDVNVNPSDFVFIREGQNQVIRYLKMMINFYKDNK